MMESSETALRPWESQALQWREIHGLNTEAAIDIAIQLFLVRMESETKLASRP